MRGNSKTKYLLLGVLLLLMGVGYAYLTADLGLEGTTHIGDDDVLVIFKNVEKTNNSNVDPTKGPIITGSKNDILKYDITLDKEQVYEFDVDMVNRGLSIACIKITKF